MLNRLCYRVPNCCVFQPLLITVIVIVHSFPACYNATIVHQLYIIKQLHDGYMYSYIYLYLHEYYLNVNKIKYLLKLFLPSVS